MYVSFLTIGNWVSTPAYAYICLYETVTEEHAFIHVYAYSLTSPCNLTYKSN